MNETIVVIIRAIIAFFSLLIFARILGKHTISQLTFFDYILGITIGSIAASLTTDLTSKAWLHWVGLFVWVLLVYMMQKIVLKWRGSAKYIDGDPTIVIMNGKILEDAMRKIRYRMINLTEQLRVEGIFDLEEVEFAVLETNGRISVLKKAEYQFVTRKDLNIPTVYKGMGIDVIYDGHLIEENLNKTQKDTQWLDEQLRVHGYNSYNDVFLAIMSTSGDLFVDGYKDDIRNKDIIHDNLNEQG